MLATEQVTICEFECKKVQVNVPNDVDLPHGHRALQPTRRFCLPVEALFYAWFAFDENELKGFIVYECQTCLCARWSLSRNTDAGAIGNTDAGAIGYIVPSTKLAKPAKVIRKSFDSIDLGQKASNPNQEKIISVRSQMVARK